ALQSVGLWEEKRYIGNYTYVEPDLYYRLRAKGWKLIFEPKAVAEHLRIQKGGCRSISPVMYKYYTFRNAFFFLSRFYGLRVVYMWPLFAMRRLLII
ncbi:MAG: hypothetical protein QW625_02220, partial [Candidatus Nanoarchaeia archaeon]